MNPEQQLAQMQQQQQQIAENHANQLNAAKAECYDLGKQNQFLSGAIGEMLKTLQAQTVDEGIAKLRQLVPSNDAPAPAVGAPEVKQEKEVPSEKASPEDAQVAAA